MEFEDDDLNDTILDEGIDKEETTNVQHDKTLFHDHNDEDFE